MNNVQQTLSSCWEKLSLRERREFITSECAQLCVAFCDARDKSIEVFHKNLVALSDFADTMCAELERREQKDNLHRAFEALKAEISTNGFTKHVSECIDALSEDVKLYLEEDPDDEYYEEADEDAYSNIVAAMKTEEAKVDALSA